MSDIYLTNSLTRKKEKFEPLNPQKVGVYACGPTVYDFATIGNFRTYFTADILVRMLKYNNYEVHYVMNITDVGHLTGDNLGDADIGEDRMEKAAKKEDKDAWEFANYYTDQFLKDTKKLNLLNPTNLPKATEHIKEQIELIEKIEKKGLTYKTNDGIYFDTKGYETVTGRKYGELSTLDVIKEGARVEPNPDKKNPRDFALWKFSPKDEKRQMEWMSPWGKGFPGWHIECSAMSMKYLGETFDIHVGGEDLRQTHHPNEVAQSEAATGKDFVKYWIHTTHLKVDGKRMGKSLGNAYTLQDIKAKGYDPLALRYLFLTAHYRDTLNFTWESLKAADSALSRIKENMRYLKSEGDRTILSPEKQMKVDEYIKRFNVAVNNDLNTPEALAVVWEALKSNIPSEDKYDLLITFDEVMGLDLRAVTSKFKIPEDIRRMLRLRETLRKEGRYREADDVRLEIENKGFKIIDTKDGALLHPIEK